MQVNEFSDSKKLSIVMEYLHSDLSLSEVSRKYFIFGHCTLSKWIAKFAAESKDISTAMALKKNKMKQSPEIKALKSDLVKTLEAENKRLKLLLEAHDIMFDIVKKETGFDVRKKAGAK